jgi:hypothetical protein
VSALSVTEVEAFATVRSKVNMKLDRHAVISNDLRHRYWLHRRWNKDLPWCVFVMLNPSTADAFKDDPTIRACIAYARELGCGGIIVVNLYAYRSSTPAGLAIAARLGHDVVGGDNDAHVKLAINMVNARRGGRVICAWGNNALAQARGERMVKMLDDGLLAADVERFRVPEHQGKFPPHPLWVRRKENERKAEAFSTPLEVWSWPQTAPVVRAL